MAYTLTVKSNAGTFSLETTGQVPDGDFIIMGSDDDSRVRIEVERHDPAGKYVIRAGHHHTHAELAQLSEGDKRSHTADYRQPGVPATVYQISGGVGTVQNGQLSGT